jgi:HD-like signal output (HDOD) protein
LETFIDQKQKVMSAPITAKISEQVHRIEAMPSVPAVLVPLLKMLNEPPDAVKLDDVVKLVSYDNTIAAQCLRVASSPLFGLTKAPQSIKAAVLSLGLRKVETILVTCCLGHAFPTKGWPLDATVFWRHSLGCALVCRKLSEKLGLSDHEKAYMAALLHDLGLLVNCLVFPKDFAIAIEQARHLQISIKEAEEATMRFTHCDSGRLLAEKWNLGADIVQVIAHHHSIEESQSAHALVALVHLGDLLCRMRNLGYGYYERQKVDLVHDPAWTVLAKTHRDLAGMDLARFTFELDEDLTEINQLVSTIFGAPAN